MQPIIRVENLGKQYRIGTREAAYSTLRENIVDAVRAPFKRFRSNGRSHDRTIWALKDVSFEIEPGEVVGIIGRNGAGKTTLLKVLSRITEPTTGSVKLYGRVGSLLEVGTGFHAELTGRENIYLNGAILGMSKNEIDRKFDEILAFAEIERFLDTPVKRYSSGMYVRLAFAVAAHLEPEILVVDEVLAVGDYAFQQKCLNKMQDVSAEGRTVLFVSHNMGAISRLCQRCILLDQGHIVRSGPANAVVQTYMTSSLVQRAEHEQPHMADKDVNLRRVALVTNDGQIRSEVGYHESFRFQLEYEVNRSVIGVSVGLGVYTVDGTCVFQSADFDAHPELLATRLPGFYQTELEIPAQWLNIGRHTLKIEIANGGTSVVYDIVEPLVFTVIDTGTPGSRHGVVRRGAVQPVLDWKTSRCDLP
jgi:lipopolysaccharide transport system ATP-binding protein